jgi:hypothetical protein
MARVAPPERQSPQMTTIILNTVSCSRPSGRDYVRGMAAAFNLRGATRQDYYFAGTAAEADAAAVQNDWDALGEDLDSAFLKVAS